MKTRSDFHPYQPKGVEFIREHKRCCLFSGLGTGKTTMTLTALSDLSVIDDALPALVIAPLRVARDGWPSEPEKWQHLTGMKVSAIVGSPEARRKATLSKADVYAVNWENVEWLIETLGSKWPFRTVIADESTHLRSFRLKQGGKRAAALAKIAKATPRWVNLSGKPSPNGLLDLWGQLWFVDFGQRLGASYRAYCDRYFTLGRDGYTLNPLPFAAEQVQAAIADVCLTISGADYFDLSEPVMRRAEVDLPQRAKKIYKDMENKFLVEVGGVEIEAPNAGVKSMKCLQIASGALFDDEEQKAWHVIHDAKIEALQRVVAEAGRAPLIVSYWWRHDLERLKAAFPAGVDLSEKGALSAFKRGQEELGFAHPQSLGHGTDGLQNACNMMVFFSEWWSLDKREQMVERIGPMRQLQAGNDREVYVWDIVARDTLDVAVLNRHASKGSVQDSLLAYFKR